NEYYFRGGHRLWHAPEDRERTYVSDDDPISIKLIDDGIQAIQPVESPTGIQKRIDVTLLAEEPFVRVIHRLTNRGARPVELAPWAITQLRPGGFAILPQPAQDTGLLPNRRLALWPYTDLNSSHIKWGNRYVTIQATMRSGKLKIGWANPAGWLAYCIDGILFVKYVDYQPQSEYFDFGSSSECYCDPHFLELETLGPAAFLEPGQSVSHEERWFLTPYQKVEPEELSVFALGSFIEERIDAYF
ncbi:MAG: hypothetical protein WA996_06620, partial [Candidatus Promineifilaceae bacterium]